jgi:UDP-glucose 4-epimerase
MAEQSIVVTGGAGFLGSHVVRRLLEDDRRVRVVDDFSNGKEMHLAGMLDDPGLEVVECDITRREAVKEALVGTNSIIHLAVLGLRQSIKDPHRVNEVIVNGTMNCLDAAREVGAGLFLNCSSSEVYGTAVRTPMDEEHPLHPETPYAAAKAAQDLYVRSYGQTYGLPWLTVRPFNMYGPNSHWQGTRGELIPKMIVRAMNGAPLTVFGDGRQTRDFTYVDDAAEALCRALDTSSCREQVVNICTGAETAIGDIAEMICGAFELDPDTGIEPQAPRPGDVRRHLGDNTRARELLGYTPDTVFVDGLAQTIDWFRSLPFAPEEMLAEEVARGWE